MNAAPATQANLDRFYEVLTKHLEDLLLTEYQGATWNAKELARRVTLGLDNGSASKDGSGVKRTCKELGIPHTYKAIREYLRQ